MSSIYVSTWIKDEHKAAAVDFNKPVLANCNALKREIKSPGSIQNK